jgi:hypothetical protein
MKSGSGVNDQLELDPQMVVAINGPAGELVNAVMATIATPSSAMAIHRPEPSNAANTMSNTSETAQSSISALESG